MSLPAEIVAETTSGRGGKAKAVAKDRRFVSLNYVVIMSTPGTPTVTVRFSTAGRLGPSYRYAPLLREVADIVCDDGGDSTFTFTVAADRNLAIGVDTLFVRYDSLHEALAVYPLLAGGAECTVLAQVYADDMISPTWYTMMVGKVTNIAAVSSGSITFVVTQVEKFEYVSSPAKTITALPTAAGTLKMAEGAKGLSVPINLGSFRSTIAGFASSVDDLVPDEFEWFLRNAAAFGLSMPMGRAVPWAAQTYLYTEPSNVFLINKEDVEPAADALKLYDGHFFMLDNEHLGRVYTGWLDNGFFRGPDNYTILNMGHHFVSIRKFPWLQVPLKCSPVGDDVDLKNACDGNPNTYATLDGGATASFEIQSPSGGFGWISANSRDDGPDGAPYDLEGDHAPAGLKILVLLASPTGSATPSGTATFRASMTLHTGTRVLGDAATFVPPSPSDNVPLKACQADLPAVIAGHSDGTAGAGWLTTHINRWEFTSDPSANAFTFSAQDGLTKPLRIFTENLDSNPVYVVSVTLLVGFRYGTDAGSPIRATAPGGRQSAYQFYPHRFDAEGNAVTTYRPYQSPTPRQYPVPFIGGAPGFGAINQREYNPAPVTVVTHGEARDGDLLVGRPGYYDNEDGDYTGEASRMITDPIHHLVWLLVNEGGVALTDIETEPGAFGSAYNVRQMLLQFWRSGAADTIGWPMDFSLTTPNKLRDCLETIGQDCMGLRCVIMPNGKYGFFIIAPMDLLGDTINAYESGAAGNRTLGAPARAIVCSKQLVADATGVALEFWVSSYLDVINNIEVKYGPNLEFTATCNATDGSDDGTGVVWGYEGYAPFTDGLTAQELCVWSEATYGARDVTRIQLPHVSLPQVAVQVGLYRLLFGYRQTIGWRATGNAGLLDVWPGHVLRFDNDLLDLANFHFPLDDSTAGLWSDKSCLVTSSQHHNDGRAVQQISGIVLPKWFRLEKCSDGDADTTPWVPPPVEPPAGTPATVGGPTEGWIERDDETFPNPNE